MRIYILCCFLFLSVWAAGQNDTWSEDQIKIQSLLTKASGFKLQGNVEKALETYQKALEVNVNVPVAHYEIARLEFINEDFAESIQSIDKAIRLDPENRWYSLFKADVQRQARDFQGAAETLESFMDYNDPDRDLLKRTATLYEQARDPEKAIATYKILEKDYGIKEEWSRSIYNLYLEQNRLDDALQTLLDLESFYPDNTDYLFQIAKHYEDTGDLDNASIYYKKIIAIDPSHPQAHLATIDPMQSSEDITSEDRLLTIMSDPNVDVDLKIKEFLPLLEKFNERYDAQTALRLQKASDALVSAHPTSAVVYAMQGDIYNASGRYGRAIQAYEETLDRQKNVIAVWEQYFDLLQLTHQYAKIKDKIEDALLVFPNQGSIAYYELLSYVFSGEGESLNYRRAELLNRKNPRVLGRLRLLPLQHQLLQGKDVINELETLITQVEDKEWILEQMAKTAAYAQNIEKAKQFAEKSEGVLSVLHTYPASNETAITRVQSLADESVSDPFYIDMFLYIASELGHPIDDAYAEKLMQYGYKPLLVQ